MDCKICSNRLDFFAVGRVLNKHDVDYYKCNQCGFVQTEDPYWLKESYSQAIADSDIGLVNRNLMFAGIAKTVIHIFFNQKKEFIDYGGGYGLFTRLMRDSGFNFFCFDRYCDNLFAKGFGADMAAEKSYELLTAFELLEHLTNPRAEIEKMLKLSDNILFSTILLPADTPFPHDWWYYGLDHGQHISFYTAESLRFLADQYKMHYSSNGSIHLFSRNKKNRLLFKIISKPAVSGFINCIRPEKSLLETDCQLIRSGRNKL